MATVPGHVGMPVFGDCSTEFYKDMLKFVDRHIEKYKSAIFSARFINTPTVFVTSHAGVKQLLNEHSDKLEFGYKAFMHHLYGDNIIFANGSQADSLRAVLKSVFTSDDSTQRCQSIVSRLTQNHLMHLDCSKSLAVYKFFKSLCTEICLRIFLDVNSEEYEELAGQIVSLTTTHWNGVVSVPFSFRVGSSRSSYRKALDAKNELLTIIMSKLSQHSALFSDQIKDGGFSSVEDAANHLLLFMSAIVPKALASLLTSCVLATADDPETQTSLSTDPEMLQNLLYEVQRLWPPLVGGRRIVKEEFELCGYHIPAGHAVVYITYHAQHDPDVFSDPDVFKPERWSSSNHSSDDLFVLGSGPRDCIGRHLVMDILKLVMKELGRKFLWQLEAADGKHLRFKWLPVLRPKDDIKVIFKVKEHESSISSETEN